MNRTLEIAELSPSMLEYVLVVLYVLCLVVIFLYSLTQLMIAWRSRGKNRGQQVDLPIDLPIITIQVPIYNEGQISERILWQLVQLDYPKELLDVQILDDSTDETYTLVAKTIQQIKDEGGLEMIHVHRTNRKGYKAGALRDAMVDAKGEYIAIFDVDFVPESSFLKEALRGFTHEKVGVVQTRWGHLNASFSLLTELQAFGLNGHFINEQNGRSSSGLFLNFNGTAGIWRTSCIIDAGGWSDDTLTEDLDLSYRAQLKGWEINYLGHVVSPAELPVTMSALKSQQHRWMKGGAECFLKNAMNLLRKKKVSLRKRIHGLFHLFNSSVFLFVITLAVISPFIAGLEVTSNTLGFILNATRLFFVSTFLLLLYYWISYQGKTGNYFRDVPRYIIHFFGYLVFSMGLSLHNAVAVLEGYAGIKSSFVRTPKFNITQNSDRGVSVYDKKRLSLLNLLEGCFFFFFLYHVIFPVGGYTSLFFIFHLMLTLGFGLVFFAEIIEFVRPQTIVFRFKLKMQ